MNDITPLTIRPSVFHVIFQLAFGGALAVAASVIITRQGLMQRSAGQALTGQVLIALGLVLLAVCLVVIVVQGVRSLRRPSLVFDHRGITDNSNVFALKPNFLPWAQVSGMALMHATLILKVKNPPRQRQNALMKQLSREFDADYTIDINLISDDDRAALKQIAKTLDKKTGVWRKLGEQ